jgi:hypothetical protein
VPEFGLQDAGDRLRKRPGVNNHKVEKLVPHLIGVEL